MARKFIQLTVLAVIFFIVLLAFKYDFLILLWNKYPLSLSTLNQQSSSLSKPLPTLARVLYLFLCENQNEIDAYANGFPSVTADVMFLCWKENCIDSKFSRLSNFYTTVWSGRNPNAKRFVSPHPETESLIIKPRVFIINERQLNLTHKTTWTTARNLLYEKALAEERRQGWRYFTFGDGDIQVDCPLADKLLKTNQTIGDEIVVVHQFRSLMNTQQTLNTNIRIHHCFILMDTFLLTVSPAIGTIGGMLISSLFDGLLFQIVYHIDAMFNAFHRDALPFVLPYCNRYDNRTWWTSQAILIYRSLCLYGHVIQFNAINIIRQIHRPYPRKGNSWLIDEDMNLSPVSYSGLKNFMRQSRIVSALAVQHYTG